eukprot:jgi/Mesvir1/12378/Mv26478-RA.1
MIRLLAHAPCYDTTMLTWVLLHPQNLPDRLSCPIAAVACLWHEGERGSLPFLPVVHIQGLKALRCSVTPRRGSTSLIN